MSRERAGRRATVALGALGLALPAVALAGGSSLGQVDGVDYWKATSMHAAPAGVSNNLGCPLGTKVTGGGFGQNAFSGELNDSFPQSKELWAVSVQFTGSGTQTLDTYAICTEGARSREVAERQLAPNKTQTLKVKCQDGKHAIGGGAAISGTIADARLNSSYPFDSGDKGSRPDDGWKARGANLSGNQLAFKAYALCAGKQPKYVSQQADDQSPGTTSGYSPFCPDSKQVLSGGVKITGPGPEAVIHDLYPRDSASDGDTVPDDGFLVNVENKVGASGSKDVTSFAICG